MEDYQEYKIKRERILNYLENKHFEGILLGKYYNFAWATCGADNRVVKGSEDGSACILFTPYDTYLIASNIEMPRLEKEEIINSGVKKVSYPWYQQDIAGLVKRLGVNPEKVKTDTPLPGFELLPCDFNSLRYQFTPQEIERYKRLGESTTKIVEEVCRKISPGKRELEVASMVEAELLSSGISPSVLLVGSDERVLNYRHPLPKEKRIEKYVMIVVCARKKGQVVNLTRCIYFGKVPGWLEERFKAAFFVDATMIVNSRPGKTLEDVLNKGIKAYQETGYPEEWKAHHQGGITGYRERECLAMPGCREVILKSMPLAWNPSIKGAKSEDTIIVGEKGFSYVTFPTSDWPKAIVEVEEEKIERADLLRC